MIIGNWKMNMDKQSARIFADRLSHFILEENIDKNKIIIAPSSVFLDALQGSQFLLAGQDCSQYKAGAYTGDVSAEQLKDMNCSYVLVGHSERRAYYNETNKIVRTKAKQVFDAGLTPVICIGETLEDRENGNIEKVIIDQLSGSIPKDIKKCVVAYEPVWAIGTGRIPKIQEINYVTDLISEQLSKLNLFENKVQILYGGSVNLDNCQEIMEIANISGLLIGGASLQHEIFIEIIKKIYLS